MVSMANREDKMASTAQAVPVPGLDQSAFAAQFMESYRVLWLIAVALTHDQALADDVVQDAAVIAMKKLNEFTPGSSFSAWMGQMVRFVALNQMRKESKRRGASLTTFEEQGLLGTRDVPAAPTTMKSAARGAIAEGQHAFDDELMAALAGVGETARACLLLRTLQGLDYSEISQLLKIPAGTAMSHVHRTRHYLRQKLAPSFGYVQPAKGGA